MKTVFSHKFKRNIFIISFLFSILILLFLYFNKDFFSFSQRTTKGEQEKNNKIKIVWYEKYVDTLIKEVAEKEPTNKKGLMRSYCDVLLNTELRDGFKNIRAGDVVFSYKPTKSVFLYHFCNIVWEEYKYKFDIKEKFLIGEFDIPNCKKKWNMNECKLRHWLSAKFDSLVNSYFNLKLATLYGYRWDLNQEEKIKKFSNKFFPWDFDDKYYLYKKQIDWNLDYCSHPKTYKMLEKQIDWISDFDTFYFSGQAVLENEEDEDAFLSLTRAFWMYNNPLDSDLKAFKNLYLNDYLFYRLFFVYYSYAISNHGKFSEFELSSNISSEIQEQELLVNTMRKGLVYRKKALKKAEEIMVNVYYTYPIHIWLMAYYEDLLNFRNTFVKLYTPFHQLYYKLRNVQTTRR